MAALIGTAFNRNVGSLGPYSRANPSADAARAAWAGGAQKPFPAIRHLF
jgi:hypothetical protein